jgi:hypothetical protein
MTVKRGRGPSNSRCSLKQDSGNETTTTAAEVADRLVKLVDEGRLTARRAELLVGFLVMEAARDRAFMEVRLERRGLLLFARPPSTTYRIESDLRRLGLPLQVAK